MFATHFLVGDLLIKLSRGYIRGVVDDCGKAKLDISLSPREFYGTISKPYDGNNVRCLIFGHNDSRRCRDCEFACKFGVLSNVDADYCRRVGRGCRDCGFEIEGYFRYGSPCPKCGSKNTGALYEGKAHIHGKHWVFELHIDPDVEDSPVTRTLCKFLGIRYDFPVYIEGYSCLGSWVNFRPDSSGFDVSTVRDLNHIIDTRISKNLLGDNLFMHSYPDEGKVYSIYGGTGKGKVIRYWENGDYLPVEEYFSKRKTVHV